MKIEKVIGREILDSRGNPTVEVDVLLECGAFGQCTSYAGDRIVSTVGRIALVKKSPKLFVKNY